MICRVTRTVASTTDMSLRFSWQAEFLLGQRLLWEVSWITVSEHLMVYSLQDLGGPSSHPVTLYLPPFLHECDVIQLVWCRAHAYCCMLQQGRAPTMQCDFSLPPLPTEIVSVSDRSKNKPCVVLNTSLSRIFLQSKNLLNDQSSWKSHSLKKRQPFHITSP